MVQLLIELNLSLRGQLLVIDEIDYFPRRERHNKKKAGSNWNDLKKQKNKKNENLEDLVLDPKKNITKKKKAR